ncbi:MAG: Rho termination factor N-terminal domain-containing protein [Acidimicrobiales bacterium]
MAVPRSVLPYPAEKINTTLDTIEGRLPAIPVECCDQPSRRLAWLQPRHRAASALGDSSEVVADAAATGTRTVTGQARSVLDRTMSTAASGTREIAGQARAQTEHFVDTVEHEAMELADEAETVADDMTEASFASWTRADLYERAQELDIEGRSGMNKAQLIDALMHETDPEG